MKQIRGRPLHFGVQLQAQRTSWPEFARALQSVEELGFDSAWTFDHLLPFAGPDDGACLETLTTLSAMAVLTSRVRIGVLVNGVLYRDPATLAKSAAQVDRMSGGRLDFSLGAAWAEREFRAYGLDFPAVSERYGRLEESLQIVKLLWGQHRTTFEGRHYRLVDAPCEPKPLQRPHPPITIGGSGGGSLRAAARHADRWNTIGAPEECAELAARLEQLCSDAGRDFAEIELSLHPNLALAPTHEAAEEQATAVTAYYGKDLEAERPRWLLGDPEEVAEQLGRYFDLGFSHFVLAWGAPFDVTTLRLFREEVLPALA